MQVKKIAEDSFASENDYADDNYNDDGGDYDEGSSFASDSDISNSFEEIHEILSRRNEKDKRDIESEDALLLVEFQSNRSCSQMSDMSVTRKDGTIPPIQFYNQKHSCFVSSIIQCLVSNPLLRKCLLSASFDIEPMKSIVKTVEEVVNREKSPTLMEYDIYEQIPKKYNGSFIFKTSAVNQFCFRDGKQFYDPSYLNKSLLYRIGSKKGELPDGLKISLVSYSL
jgi:hypothetical protein